MTDLALQPLSPSNTKIKTVYKPQKPWIETPLIESAILSKKAGCRIFLKLENLQPGGSFKSRAMASLILHHIHHPSNNTHKRRLHFFINSGGNAGLAAVCAARTLSYPCTVVVPTSTSRLMVDKLCAAGATRVIQYGDTIAAAGEYMTNSLMADGKDEEGEEGEKKIALHPFDHEAIWEGNSTIVDELATQLPPADEDDDGEEEGDALPMDAVICSVGGGGLMNGLIQGIQRHRRSPKKKKRDIHILAVETDGTQSMNLAMSSRALVTLPKITSMAVSLACVRVSQRTFEYCVDPPEGVRIHSAVLSDAEAARGCLRLADDERILVELACGVCVEAAVGDASALKLKGRKRGRVVDQDDDGLHDIKKKRVDASPLLCPSDSGVGSSSSSSSSSSDTESDIVLSNQLSSSCLRQMIPDLTPQSRVVIIVCGGSNVTTGMASEWRDRLANGWV